MTADATDVSGDSDLSMNVFTGFDDAHFYLGAEVMDDALVFEKSGDAIADNNAVGFWLNANQYGVTLVEGQPVLGRSLSPRFTTKGPTLTCSRPSWRGDVAGANPFRRTTRA